MSMSRPCQLCAIGLLVGYAANQAVAQSSTPSEWTALFDGASLNGADLRAVLKESSDFLSSERHGLERLYDIIQSRKLQ